jgi:hypothetical protein
VFLIIMRRRGRPAEEAAAEEAPLEAAADAAPADSEAEKALEDVEALLEEAPAKGGDLADEGDDAVVVRAPDKPGEAVPDAAGDEEESHVVSRPVTHQRGRGRTPPRVAPKAATPQAGGGLKEMEADAELETDEQD